MLQGVGSMCLQAPAPFFHDPVVAPCDPVNSAHVDKVSRLYAKSKNYEMDLTLDYNIELFPLKAGQTFTLSLATSLSRGSVPGKEGEGEDKEQQWRPDGKGQKGIEEDYEYVMFGKVRTA